MTATFTAKGYTFTPGKGFAENQKSEVYTVQKGIQQALFAWLFLHQQHNVLAEANYMGICHCPDCGSFVMIQTHEPVILEKVPV